MIIDYDLLVYIIFLFGIYTYIHLLVNILVYIITLIIIHAYIHLFKLDNVTIILTMIYSYISYTNYD